MSQCPCGTDQEYEICCGPYHSGELKAPTAESLMRSRYCAYTLGQIDYLVKTIPLLERKTFDRSSAKEWAQSSEWLGLEIVSTKDGLENDKKGVVEFKAKFRQNGVEKVHHEISTFKKNGDRWLFTDAKVLVSGSVTEESAGVSRNAPCPCGSGKKFKKCCAA